MDEKNWNSLYEKLKSENISKGLLDEFVSLKGSSFESIEYYKAEINKFKLIFDMTPCTISWIKSDLTYGGVNQYLADICEMDPKEFIGKEVGFHTSHNYFYNFSKLLFENTSKLKQDELESKIDGIDKRFWCVGTKFNEGDEAIIIGVDVTELSSLRDSIVLMERLSALGEMVAGLVHEINNPLTLVLNKAMLIPKYLEKKKYDKVHESALLIARTGDKIGKIVKGVKSFVRKGDQDPFSRVKVYELIEEALLICECKLVEGHINVEIPKGEGPVVDANATQLFQVIVNLVTNAIDEMVEYSEKWIKIEVIEIADEIEIRVQDPGKGITKEIESKIFESFYTTKAANKGTGIGLSLSRKIIEGHKGTLTLDHEAKSTTFVVKLPCRSSQDLAG